MLVVSTVSAQSMIQVTVKSSYKNVFAIGFSANGQNHGAMGRSYSGNGPKGASYLFGFREGLFSGDTPCGQLQLTKDSVVELVVDGKKCTPQVRY